MTGSTSRKTVFQTNKKSSRRRKGRCDFLSKWDTILYRLFDTFPSFPTSPRTPVRVRFCGLCWHSLLFIDRDLRIPRFMEDYTSWLRSTGFSWVSETPRMAVRRSVALGARTTELRTDPFHSVGIDHIQHPGYIICCCMLDSCALICRPGVFCKFNNFLKRQCCLHFLFLCILHHCYCTTWSWSRVLVSLALQRSPTGFPSHLSLSSHTV